VIKRGNVYAGPTPIPRALRVAERQAAQRSNTGKDGRFTTQITIQKPENPCAVPARPHQVLVVGTKMGTAFPDRLAQPYRPQSVEPSATGACGLKREPRDFAT
jgi:hypothetical protein